MSQFYKINFVSKKLNISTWFFNLDHSISYDSNLSNEFRNLWLISTLLWQNSHHRKGSRDVQSGRITTANYLYSLSHPWPSSFDFIFTFLEEKLWKKFMFFYNFLSLQRTIFTFFSIIFEWKVCKSFCSFGLVFILTKKCIERFYFVSMWTTKSNLI